MQVVILKTPEAVAAFAADVCTKLIETKPDAVLGLATGSTPLLLYRALIERHQKGLIDFSQVRTFNLDEYLGLSPDHSQSYRTFMNENFFNAVNIDPAKTHFPTDACDNPLEAGPRYEAAIREAGGIDLQVLGIGRNGHIGFNEPTSSLSSRCRTKTLTHSTIEANRRFFRSGELQPTTAVTMGMGTILDARRIILLATGPEKAKAVHACVEGPVTSMWPATVLQLHNHATVIIEDGAASKLRMKGYYRQARADQDAWIEKFGDPVA